MKPTKSLILLSAAVAMALGSSAAIAKSKRIIAPNNKAPITKPSYTPIPKGAKPGGKAGFVRCPPGTLCPIIQLPPPWGPPILK